MAGTKPGHDDGKGVTSMKRALVFLLLGPSLWVSLAWLKNVIAGKGGDFGESPVMTFLFGLVVVAATGAIDGYLAHFVPMPLRAALTALVGAILVVGLVLALVGMMLRPEFLMQFAIAGALCMGTCSLLANDYRR